MKDLDTNDPGWRQFVREVLADEWNAALGHAKPTAKLGRIYLKLRRAGKVS